MASIRRVFVAQRCYLMIRLYQASKVMLYAEYSFIGSVESTGISPSEQLQALWCIRSDFLLAKGTGSP